MVVMAIHILSRPWSAHFSSCRGHLEVGLTHQLPDHITSPVQSLAEEQSPTYEAEGQHIQKADLGLGFPGLHGVS